MADIRTAWRPELVRGDWDFVSPAQPGDDLATAAAISLLSDATAGQDDVIPDGDDPRGWWGDTGRAGPIGSRIWLRLRAKQTDALLVLVKADIADALAWMIDDGVAARIEVVTEWARPGMLGAQVTIARRDGGEAALNFAWAWKEL